MSYYEVIVESYIDKKRFKDFITLEVSHLPDGSTRIFGELDDQIKLFSLMNRIIDMNLNLVLVKRIKEDKER